MFKKKLLLITIVYSINLCAMEQNKQTGAMPSLAQLIIKNKNINDKDFLKLPVDVQEEIIVQKGSALDILTFIKNNPAYISRKLLSLIPTRLFKDIQQNGTRLTDFIEQSKMLPQNIQLLLTETFERKIKLFLDQQRIVVADLTTAHKDESGKVVATSSSNDYLPIDFAIVEVQSPARSFKTLKPRVVIVNHLEYIVPLYLAQRLETLIINNLPKRSGPISFNQQQIDQIKSIELTLQNFIQQLVHSYPRLDTYFSKLQYYFRKYLQEENQ